ncbi:MAG: hypothetical protein GWM88_17205 [Pseudomonadales bacterium]|nr:hypothetical protein [Pseudomonadales bacterium]NIX09671.1 hypothetical protein [Pseudomonadales bacterium]
MIYDDLDRHLPAAGSIERAVVPMGMYLAWCVNLQLTGQALEEEAGALVLRVRYREKTGSELLLAACGGALDGRWLNEAGRRFTDEYYKGYLADFRSVFGAAVYDVEDDWDHYDRLAPVLTRRYMGGRGQRQPGSRRWWKFWK